MDVYSGKRAVGRIAAPRKGSGHALRDTDGSRDGPVQFCSRLGCSGRLNYLKGTQNKCLEKPKPLRPSSFRSSYGKEVMGSSSKSCSSVTSSSKPLQESHKKLSSNESEIQELNTTSRNHTELKLKSRYIESNKTPLMPVGKTASEVVSPNTKITSGYRQKSGLPGQDAHSGSPDNGRKKNIVKRRFIEGDRGKKIGDSSSHEGLVSSSIHGLSASDPRHSRRAASRGSGVSSVRTRRPVNVDTATGCINQLHGNSSSSVRSTNVTPDVNQTEISWFAVETSSSGSSLLDGSRANSDTLLSMIPVTSTNRSIVGFTDCNDPGRYNIDGIADVLLALERIEQDEELTYEQLLSLEANPFLGGLNFFDQHRDMRLDIDNMSYEDLLALEEKMGTVSTALSEEELSKCLRVSIYEPLHLKQRRTKSSWNLDDTKCSICQEEFVVGDELGNLGCTHGYHAACINQWLQLKNWCPICKASAEASNSSS